MDEINEEIHGYSLMVLLFGFSYGFQQVLLILFEKNITYWQSLGICFMIFVILGFIRGK